MAMIAICRLCASLRRKEVLSRIDDEDLCQRVLQCLNIHIEMDDILPKHICGDCKQSLNSSYVFHKKVHEAQESLKLAFLSKKNKLPGVEKEILQIIEEHKTVNNSNVIKSRKEVILEKQDVSVNIEGQDGILDMVKLIVAEVTETPQVRIEKAHELADNDRNANKEYLSLPEEEPEDNEIVQEIVLNDDQIVVVEGNEELEKAFETLENISGEDHSHQINLRLREVVEVGQESPTEDEDFVFYQLVENCSGDEQLDRMIDNENEEMEILSDENKVDEEIGEGETVEYYQLIGNDIEEVSAEEELILNLNNTKAAVMDSQKEDVSIQLNEHANEDAKATTPKFNKWSDYNWRCNFCSHISNSFLGLLEHSQDKHECTGSLDMQYKCDDCQKISVRYYAFLNHVRHHHSNLNLCCDVCNKIFDNYKQLALHRRQHSYKEVRNPQVVHCAQCGKGFLHETAVRKHVQGKHIEKPTLFKCMKCEKSFTRLSSLRAHQRVHSDVKDFNCEICGSAFRRKVNLEAHMYKHIDERLFECKICKKKFKSSISLEKHVLMHSSEKEFSCDHCDKTFRTKDEKLSHERVHTGERPYKCTYCDRSFGYRSTLKDHLNTHTGNSPYSCVNCNRNFTNWSNFNKHRKRRHDCATGVSKTNN